MREEVTQWLNDYNLQPGKLRAKWNIPLIAIVEAVESVYNKVQAGMEIKPIRIGWTIRALAIAISRRDDIQEVKDIQTASEKIFILENELKLYTAWFKLSWYKRLFKRRPF